MDPINPIAGNPEALNQEPTPKATTDNHWVTIVSMAIFVLLSLAAVAFLYYQNQQLKSMLASYQPQPTVSPSPVATTDPTANWKTYTSSNNYQVRYPIDWKVETESSGFSVVKGNYKIVFTFPSAFGPGICIFSDSPNFNNPYTDNPILAASKCPGEYVEFKGESGTFRRRSTPNVSPEGVLNGNWSIYTKDQDSNFVTVPPISYTIPTPEYDKSAILLMDQILSTFKFISPTTSPSAKPVACTLEAKLCPDGSTVGRTGPNCEFAPCPTP